MVNINIIDNKSYYMGKGHGFIKNFISSNSLLDVIKKISLIESNLEQGQKYYDLTEFIDEFKKVIFQSPHRNKIHDLLSSNELIIEALELHNQYPGCSSIPAHQDNFYHNIEKNLGLKILLPFQNLNYDNGGLVFYDVEEDFPVLNHMPSDVESFSSFISEETIQYMNLKATAYNYEEGDITYHFLNTPHFSYGNKKSKKSAFLVFRIHTPFSKENKLMQERYYQNYKEHLRLINKSEK